MTSKIARTKEEYYQALAAHGASEGVRLFESKSGDIWIKDPDGEYSQIPWDANNPDTISGEAFSQ